MPQFALARRVRASLTAQAALLLVALFAHSAVASAATYTLKVVLPSSNPGTVTAAGGINCTPFCQATYNGGSSVTLYAWPDGNSTFGGWAGASGCGSASTCTVTLNSDTTVTATFNGPGGGGGGSGSSSSAASSSSSSAGGGQSSYTVTVVLPSSSPGSVTAAGGINCTPFCSATYAAGSSVTLNEWPDGNSYFGGWSVAGCGSSSKCTVAVNSNITVTATFCTPGAACSVTGGGGSSSSSSSAASSSSSSAASSSSSSAASSSSSSAQSSSSSSASPCGSCSTQLQVRYLDANHSQLAYYDPALNITWLQNTNYGAGSGYDDGKFNFDGRMTWNNAMAWARTLSFGAPGAGSGWRLPSIESSGGLFCQFSLQGGTACGQNVITTPGARNYSELAHMFQDTLGNTPAYNIYGGINPTPWLRNIGPFSVLYQDYNAVWYGSPSCNSDFRNCRDDAYWTNQTDTASGGVSAWKFLMGEGEQIGDNKLLEYFAWAVHDGDVGYQ